MSVLVIVCEHSKLKKHDHISDTLKTLYWLPIKYRIDYKIILLTFKCLHEQGPQYLSELLHPYQPFHNLCSKIQSLLKESKTRTTIGERAFSACAPHLWNRLPQELKDIKVLNVFKTELKTHFLNCLIHRH